jgi:hypothetical protein
MCESVLRAQVQHGYGEIGKRGCRQDIFLAGCSYLRKIFLLRGKVQFFGSADSHSQTCIPPIEKGAGFCGIDAVRALV